MDWRITCFVGLSFISEGCKADFTSHHFCFLTWITPEKTRHGKKASFKKRADNRMIVMWSQNLQINTSSHESIHSEALCLWNTSKVAPKGWRKTTARPDHGPSVHHKGGTYENSLDRDFPVPVPEVPQGDQTNTTDLQSCLQTQRSVCRHQEPEEVNEWFLLQDWLPLRRSAGTAGHQNQRRSSDEELNHDRGGCGSRYH